MDYEQKYKEALDWMRSVYPTMTGANKEDAEHFFPELKESEDERVIKELTSLFKDGIKGINHRYTGEDCERWIAWLEKQGEKDEEILILKDQIESLHAAIEAVKETHRIELKKQGEQKPADKPKFKVGDWVIGRATSNEPRQISEITDQCYKSTYGGQYGFSFEEDMHLWTIQDAKDGDVLIFEGFYNSIVLFQGIGINGKGRINYHCKCDLGNYSFDVQGDVACLGTIEKDAEHYHPATKEQRDLLFQKMKEAGYEWDSENRELMKIDHKELTDFQERLRGILIESNGKYDDNTVIRLSGQVLELVEQKPEPAWSKEDEKIYQSIMDDIVQENQLDDKQTDWLKSLKDRIQPKVELTQLDKNILEAAIAFVELNNHFNCWRGVDKHTVLSALHSLRPQNRWKPTGEQMKYLHKYAEQNNYDGAILTSLYNDLKKLREE